MEVNLYHILFIVLICITIVIAIYPKKVLTKITKSSVLSIKNSNVFNFLEISALSYLALVMLDLSSIYKILFASVLSLYIQLRLIR